MSILDDLRNQTYEESLSDLRAGLIKVATSRALAKIFAEASEISPQAASWGCGASLALCFFGVVNLWYGMTGAMSHSEKWLRFKKASPRDVPRQPSV
jgi:hypothetical protein